MKKLTAKLASFGTGALLVLSVWQIAHMVLDVNVLPSPLAVFRSVPGLAGRDMLAHASHSFFRVGMGLFFSMLIGLVLGIAAAGKGALSKVLTPFIYFTYPMPKVALLPAVMLLFGLTNLSKIIMITLIVVFPIIVVVRDSVKEIPRQTYNTLICYGASRPQVFWYVTLPWAVSGILSTARISLGTAVSILFFVEAYGSRYGMGFFILDAWMRLNYIQMYAGIVVLSIFGFILFIAIDLAESIAMKWKKG